MISRLSRLPALLAFLPMNTRDAGLDAVGEKWKAPGNVDNETGWQRLRRIFMTE